MNLKTIALLIAFCAVILSCGQPPTQPPSPENPAAPTPFEEETTPPSTPTEQPLPEDRSTLCAKRWTYHEIKPREYGGNTRYLCILEEEYPPSDSCPDGYEMFNVYADAVGHRPYYDCQVMQEEGTQIAPQLCFDQEYVGSAIHCDAEDYKLDSHSDEWSGSNDRVACWFKCVIKENPYLENRHWPCVEPYWPTESVDLGGGKVGWGCGHSDIHDPDPSQHTNILVEST